MNCDKVYSLHADIKNRRISQYGGNKLHSLFRNNYFIMTYKAPYTPSFRSFIRIFSCTYLVLNAVVKEINPLGSGGDYFDTLGISGRTEGVHFDRQAYLGNYGACFILIISKGNLIWIRRLIINFKIFKGIFQPQIQLKWESKGFFWYIFFCSSSIYQIKKIPPRCKIPRRVISLTNNHK